MSESGDRSVSSQPTALKHAEALSRALTNAARRARFANRLRSASRGGFESRRGAQFLRVMIIALFVGCVLIPCLVSTVYFALVASDQYVASSEFTVSSGVIPKMDGVGSVTGVPSELIVQDTQVVTAYIHSRAMVEELERSIGLREMYATSDADWWARFRKDDSIERFIHYWNSMSRTAISMPSGIVTLTVRAFSPQDAKRVADEVVRQSESLINNLNARMLSDTVVASEHDLERAAAQLAHVRAQMELVRNEAGVLDVSQTSKELLGLVAGVQAELLKSEQELQTQLRYVKKDAPQVRVLSSRISALRTQLDDLKAQITVREENAHGGSGDNQALSGKMTKFAELQLEERIAEKHYALLAAALEAARMLSERRMLYLHEVVRPALPQEAEYPKRLLDIGLTFVASLALWGSLVGGMMFVRNHMA